MLENFLENKPLYYDEIDYTRMPRIYAKIKNRVKIPKIIHLVGTNGKGTTGRFLAAALYSLGFSTGHYTSPHILEFNERIWCNGKNIATPELDKAHKELLQLLSLEDADALSYFEYTTLIALLCYQECDYVVLEAGLGGEYDATAVFDNILTLVTPIDFDHEAFLGTSIKEIATTKLNAVNSAAMLALQPHKEVYIVAAEIAAKKSLKIVSFSEYLNAADEKKITHITKELGLVEYLQDNLKLAIAALKFLGIIYEAKNFFHAKLFGRLSKLNENIYLDVGHNTLAASSIAKALQGKKYRLVYNSYRDKNYKEILRILKPIVKEVEIIAVNEERIEESSLLKGTLSDLGMKHSDFSSIDPTQEYLVFGSFSVAETFLRSYYNG